MLKQTLLAFTVLGFAGTAAAADITNPFFLPEGGHVASVTSGTFSESTFKDNDGWRNRDYTKVATEQLAFGIVNNLAIIGEVSKDWTKTKWADGTSSKDHNDLDWNAGLAWNILHCNTKLQVSSVYGQDAPGVKGTYKYFDTEVKLGYQFKTFLPYATFKVHTPVAQTSEWRTNKWGYSGKVGVYQGKCGVWALDTALAWAFDRTDSHTRTLTAEAEASYYLTKNMTVGIYGSYLLDGKTKWADHMYDKAVGARLRLYF
ncbi:MAG: hypothetical protein II938_01500 [Alphaproteobacteria bacterium]|nr:hypothetical protein [Alphaproteobacteria bacterium]